MLKEATIIDLIKVYPWMMPPGSVFLHDYQKRLKAIPVGRCTESQQEISYVHELTLTFGFSTKEKMNGNP